MFGYFSFYFVEIIDSAYAKIQGNLVKGSFRVTCWKYLSERVPYLSPTDALAI